MRLQKLLNTKSLPLFSHYGLVAPRGIFHCVIKRTPSTYTVLQLDPQYSTLLFLTSNNLGSFTLFWKIGETRLKYTVLHNEEHLKPLISLL